MVVGSGGTPRQMQMLVTRFERLSRRISLAGLMSGQKAVEAISSGRVLVDNQVARGNFKVFSEASVVVDGCEAPAPRPRPRIWALNKPRKVLCSDMERDGAVTLRSLLRSRHEHEVEWSGNARTVGLADETLWDKHFVVVSGLSFMADGLVLLTNDGHFADTLMSTSSKILSIYEVKISGDPPIELLHTWRRRARAGGVDFGQVFVSIMKRSATTCKLSVRYVETPERPLELLLEKGKMKLIACRRFAFGPYLVTELPRDRCIELPVHKSLMHLCPKADMRQVLVPATGGILNSAGLLQEMVLQGSVAAPTAADAEEGLHADGR